MAQRNEFSLQNKRNAAITKDDMITGELKSQVDKIWEAFWTGGISNPLTVIEQFTFLLFLRRLDERQLLEEKKANMTGSRVESPIYAEAHQKFRWHTFKNLDPESLFALFTQPQIDSDNLTTFEHMKQLGSSVGVFATFMKGATFMIPTSKLLDQVVQMIDKIQMDDRDTKGDLYEYLLSKIATAGTNGQFRTPRHIIKMMVEVMRPMVILRPDKQKCTPHFLVSQLNNVKVFKNLLRYSSGSAQPQFSASEIKKFNALIPPLDHQNQFAERSQAIEAQKQQAQAGLKKSEDLFNSLLQRAFKGELTC